MNQENIIRLYFPKQETKPAVISRAIRQSKVFKPFVTKRSRDMRYLTINFKTEDKYNILKPLLLQTLENTNYAYEIVE